MYELYFLIICIIFEYLNLSAFHYRSVDYSFIPDIY